ncbi:MAG: tyrosine-type recombinase/integrase [Burkholderiales bacterium]|nr:tyrosine-type recombinase/integrase [Burkholderiales bacterium]
MDASFTAKINCHMLRHIKVMHMLQAGGNVLIIRDFLGLVDIDTTMAYVRADNQTKEDLFSKVMSRLGEVQPAEDGQKEQDLLDFLDGLKLGYAQTRGPCDLNLRNWSLSAVHF